MKKLISLIVMMVFVLGAMAVPPNGEPNLDGKAVLNTAVAVQLGAANIAAIDQTETDLSEAGIGQFGLHNTAYIEQVGKKNDAGVMAMTYLPNVCEPSYTCLFNKLIDPVVSNVGLSFDLICGQTVEVGEIVADLPLFTTGIYQLGAFNLGSIVQEGKKNKAGIVQLGLANQAGLHQDGDKNKAGINQVGVLNQSVVDQTGKKNIALVHVEGFANRTVVDQDGNSNIAVQIVEGMMNTAIIDQLGCKNTAIQAVDGGCNLVLANQKGAFNRSVQTIEGCMNVNEVFQIGIANSAFIEQGIPGSVSWSGIINPEISLNRDDCIVGICLPIKDVNIVAPTFNPHDD